MDSVNIVESLRSEESEDNSIPDLESVTSEDEERRNMCTPRPWVPCFQHQHECALRRLRSLSRMNSSNTTEPSDLEEAYESDGSSEGDIPELITDDEMEASGSHFITDCSLSEDESEDDNGYESGDEDMTPHTDVYPILHECTPICHECQRQTTRSTLRIISGGHRRSVLAWYLLQRQQAT
jgi:hypothetical protein